MEKKDKKVEIVMEKKPMPKAKKAKDKKKKK